ncbi:unknown [Eubacterium sp. CAG:786]|nr:unknown [Eubacterium sp. CAG:786]
MQNAHGYPGVLPREERQERQRAQVAVHYAVLVLGEEPAQRPDVLHRVPECRQHEQPPPQRLYFLDGNVLRPLEQIEIELYLFPVDGAVVVHDHLFDAATVHLAEYLCNSHEHPP